MNSKRSVSPPESSAVIGPKKGPRHRRRRPLVWFAAGLLFLTNAPTVRAQSVEDELRSMRAEIEDLRREVKSLKEELHPSGTTARVEAVSPAPLQASEASATAASSVHPASPEGAESPAANLAMVQSQVAELAQTKVESNSKLPIRIFGTILSGTFYNTGDANWADSPTLALSAGGAPSQRGSFSSSLRQSRIGLMADGPTIGSMKTSAFLAVDFYGGTAAFQSSSVFGLPRLVYGYVRLEGARTALEAGQDQMIFAPKNPTSLAAMAFPELYQSGNLYLRAPQLRVERQVIQSKSGSLNLALGLVAPVGTYPTPVSYYPGGGEPWRKPAVQARLGWQSSAAHLGEGRGLEVAASGQYGRGEYFKETNEPISSWAGAVDFDVHVGRFGFGAEGFRGQNLGALGGGIGQPGKAVGGFFEGRLRATRRLQLNAGMGTDQIIDPYVLQGLIHKNTGLFTNSIFQFTPELSTSFEYRRIETSLFTGEVRHNNHFDFVVAYSF